MSEFIFLGTKAKIESRSKHHQFHSSLAVKDANSKIMIDFGIEHRYDYPGHSKADALLITHAHPDHYAWVQRDVNTVLKVYLTKDTYEYGKYKPEKYHVIHPGKPFEIGRMEILPYRVIHSTRCPAVGFRILLSSGSAVVYNPDVIDIEKKDSVLSGAAYYVGDGSSIRTNLVRKQAGRLFGHAKVTTQVNWCKKFGIPHIIFTHIGQDTIDNMEKFSEENPEVIFAKDAMTMKIG